MWIQRKNTSKWHADARRGPDLYLLSCSRRCRTASPGSRPTFRASIACMASWINMDRLRTVCLEVFARFSRGRFCGRLLYRSSSIFLRRLSLFQFQPWSSRVLTASQPSMMFHSFLQRLVYLDRPIYELDFKTIQKNG